MLAIEQDAKVDVLHACGGNARCTTCRVEFVDGEPDDDDRRGTAGARRASGVTGVRLSCQILCDHDMTVRAISRLTGSGRPDPGPTPDRGDHPAAGVGPEVAGFDTQSSPADRPLCAYRSLIRGIR